MLARSAVNSRLAPSNTAELVVWITADGVQRRFVASGGEGEPRLCQRELTGAGEGRDVAPIHPAVSSPVEANLSPLREPLDQCNAGDLGIKDRLSRRRQDPAH